MQFEALHNHVQGFLLEYILVWHEWVFSIAQRNMKTHFTILLADAEKLSDYSAYCEDHE
jgi:hypothetical protein